MTQPPPYPGTPEPSDEPGGATPPPIPPTQQPPTYGAPAAQPPAYGNPYGAPQQPAYGAPQQPYAQPYGGAYPGGPGQDQPSKGMAIAALVLSFLACTFVAGVVAIVLAIVVLVRGKDGRNHGKGLAIAALVISVLVMLATVGVIVLAADFVEEQSIDNLETGQCIDAENLTDDSSDSIGLIDKVSCTGDHDGQVVATSTLTAAQASAASDGIDCTPLVEPGLMATLDPAEIQVYGLTQDTSPETGDAVACVAVRADGKQLTEKLG